MSDPVYVPLKEIPMRIDRPDAGYDVTGSDTIASARRLVSAATPGPWTVEWTGGVDHDGEGWSHCEIGFSDPLEPHAGLMMGDHGNAVADAGFIAAARTLLPALLDELATVLAERDRARDLAAKLEQQLAQVAWVREQLAIAHDHEAFGVGNGYRRSGLAYGVDCLDAVLGEPPSPAEVDDRYPSLDELLRGTQ